MHNTCTRDCCNGGSSCRSVKQLKQRLPVSLRQRGRQIWNWCWLTAFFSGTVSCAIVLYDVKWQCGAYTDCGECTSLGCYFSSSGVCTSGWLPGSVTVENASCWTCLSSLNDSRTPSCEWCESSPQQPQRINSCLKAAAGGPAVCNGSTCQTCIHDDFSCSVASRILVWTILHYSLLASVAVFSTCFLWCGYRESRRLLVKRQKGTTRIPLMSDVVESNPVPQAIQPGVYPVLQGFTE